MKKTVKTQRTAKTPEVVSKPILNEPIGKLAQALLLQKAMTSYASYNLSGKNSDPSLKLGRVGVMSYDIMLAIYQANAMIRMIVDYKVKMLVNLDWEVKGMDGYKPTDAERKQVVDLMRNPNSQDSYYEFMTKILEDLFVYDAFAIEVGRFNKNDLASAPTALFPVDASSIIPEADEHGIIRQYKQIVRQDMGAYGLKTPAPIIAGGKEQKTAIFKPEQFIYAHEYPSNNRLWGRSPLEALILEVSADMNAMKYNARYLDDGYLWTKLLLLPDFEQTNLDQFLAQLKQTKGNANEFPVASTPEGKGTLLDFGMPIDKLMNDTVFNYLFKRACGVYQVSASEILEFQQYQTKAAAGTQFKVQDHKGFRPIKELLEGEINTSVVWKINPRLQWVLDPERLDERSKIEIQTEKIAAGKPFNEIREDNGEKPIIFTMDWQGQKINPFDLPFSDRFIVPKNTFGADGADQGAGATDPKPDDKAKAAEKTIALRKEQSLREKLRGILGQRRSRIAEQKRESSLGAKMRPVVKKLTMEVVKAIEAYPPPLMKSAGLLGGKSVLRKDLSDNWIDYILSKGMNNSDFEDEADAVLQKGVKRTIKEASDQIVGSITDAVLGYSTGFGNQFINTWAMDYYRERFYNKGVLAKITQTQRDQIAQVMIDEYKEGSSITDFTQAIKDRFSKFDDYQAERIARTEDFLADTSAEKQIWKEMGVKKFDFIVADGSCALCQAIAEGGSPLDYDAKFSGKAAGVDFPGNPYTIDQMNKASVSSGFSDGLPHPNCEDAWTASAELTDAEMSTMLARVQHLAQNYV